MKILNGISGSVLVIELLAAMGCQPPYKPDYDSGYGQLIYADMCGQEPLYLMDLVSVNAYQSGQDYRDTLMIDGARYTHVVRLDSSQAAFLSKRKTFDKVGIDFRPLIRRPLPSCASVTQPSVQSVQVLSINNTNY